VANGRNIFQILLVLSLMGKILICIHLDTKKQTDSVMHPRSFCRWCSTNASVTVSATATVPASEGEAVVRSPTNMAAAKIAAVDFIDYIKYSRLTSTK